MTVLRMLYNSLILPHLSYGILTSGAKISRDDKLHLIQKRCIRIIANSSYIAHTEPICKDLRISLRQTCILWQCGNSIIN